MVAAAEIVEPGESAHHADAIDAFLATANCQPPVRLVLEPAATGYPAAPLAEVLFARLQTILITADYEPYSTNPVSSIQGRTYNCLTATLLYVALCRQAGLEAGAVARPGHVCAQVREQGQVQVIELTVPFWTQAQRGQPTAEERELSDGEFLGRVYYNLGLNCAYAGDLERAVWATAESYRLDPAHDEARANLLATLNNWSLELTGQGEFERAADAIRDGLRIDGQYVPLLKSWRRLKELDPQAARR